MRNTSDNLQDLRVLFVSGFTPGYYGSFRLAALQRLELGAVVPFDQEKYSGAGLLGKLQFRTQIGVDVRRFNNDLLKTADEHKVNIALFDKALSLHPQTLRALHQLGVFTIDYVIDNPFGPRNDPGWRLYKKTQPHFDLHAVQRASSVTDYEVRGARNVMQIRTSYEPTIHFPPPSGWSDRDRAREVSFIGTPYDRRAEFLSTLARSGAPLSISGSEPHWRAALPPEVFSAAFRDGELKAAEYRDAIWRSKINLAFVTRANNDEVAHKSFEITACQGFLLAERTPGHQDCFREDEEAVFFSDESECIEKIRRYLPDEPARRRIAAAGHKRAITSGYDNDSMLRRVLERAIQLR